MNRLDSERGAMHFPKHLHVRKPPVDAQAIHANYIENIAMKHAKGISLTHA